MSPEKIDLVKLNLVLHSAKKLIKITSTCYISPILFVDKYNREIQFCVDQQKLNTISKNICYSISVIKKTLKRLKNAKYLIKIDIG